MSEWNYVHKSDEFPECECDILGTNGTIKHCDRYTGQCPCLKNVEGPLCDLCVENHWKIASGEGCETCDCDPVGAEREQCNPVSCLLCKWDFSSIWGNFILYFDLSFLSSTPANVCASQALADASAINVSATTGAIRTFSVMVSSRNELANKTL